MSMFRRSNKRKSELDNSIDKKPKQKAVAKPEQAQGMYENTMSREEFILHNEDARKVYEDIKRLRQSVESLKKTGVDQVPEEIQNSPERIHLKETEDIVAAKQAVLEQAKRDYLAEKAKRVEAARKEQEAIAQQLKVMEAQKRAAMVEEEAERKRLEAEDAERRAKETTRKAALEAMEAARKAKEEAGLISQESAQAAAKAVVEEKPKAHEIDAELEQAKKHLLIAQRQQEAKLDRISQATEAHTTKLAETKQEILEQQHDLIRSGHEEAAAILDEHKEARFERLAKDEKEKLLRKQRALEEKRLKEEQAKALKAEKLAKAQAIKAERLAKAQAEKAEKIAKAQAEKEEKRIREEKKKAERLRKAEERELLKRAKKDAEARAKLERLRLEAKSQADAELGGGIVNVQGMTINTEIKEIPHIAWRDLFNLKSKKERQAESAAERRKLAKERRRRSEQARRLVDVSWRKRLIRYEKTKFARKFRKFKIYCENHKVKLLTIFAILLMAVVGTAGVLNYYTAYAYSYNGKTLGVVKEKDDVLRITDLVQGALTEDKNVEVVIDARDDIKFERVTTLGDVEIDTSEDVLKRLTYMGDLNVKAYGIYINGKKVGAVESKEVAAEVIQEIKDQYVSDMEGAKIEEAVFIEQVEVKQSNTDLQDVATKEEMIAILCTDRETETVHEIVAGESLADIAKLYSLKESDIIADNEGVSPKNLIVGSKIVIRKDAPILTVKITEKVTYDKVVKYEIVKKDSKKIYEGYTEVKQAGKNGLTEVTSRIVLVNGKQVEENPLKTTVKSEPVTKIVLVGTKERPPSVGSGKYIWPFKSGYTLTSGFKYRWGRLHEGIDLGTPTGNDVLAADGGVVTYAGYSGAYGYLIKIDHQNGMETRYAHNSKLLVSTGEKVFQGMHIAESGNSGRSTGPHLHFEIRVGGVPKDPLSFLP